MRKREKEKKRKRRQSRRISGLSSCVNKYIIKLSITISLHKHLIVNTQKTVYRLCFSFLFSAHRTHTYSRTHTQPATTINNRMFHNSHLENEENVTKSAKYSFRTNETSERTNERTSKLK